MSAGDPGEDFDWAGAYGRLAAWRQSLSGEGALPVEEGGRILAARARALAAPPEAAAEGERNDLLVFALSGNRFGLRMAQVEAVMPLGGATAVPCTPSVIHGFVSFRGEILVVLDLRPYLGLAAADAEGAVAIVVEGGSRRFGIRADAVVGTETVEDGKITPMSALAAETAESAYGGVTLDLVTLLDTDRLAHDPRLIVNEEMD